MWEEAFRFGYVESKALKGWDKRGAKPDRPCVDESIPETSLGTDGGVAVGSMSSNRPAEGRR